MLTDKEVAEALAVCEAATPGPWHTDQISTERRNAPAFCGRLNGANDAAFVASARTLPRALLELQEARVAMRDVIEAARKLCSYDWEGRLDDSAVSDRATDDARELSYAIYEYDRAMTKGRCAMTDRERDVKKAGELLTEFKRRAMLRIGGHGAAVADLAEALAAVRAEARAQALEEAAQVMDKGACWCRDCGDPAAAIRSLPGAKVTP